VPHAPAVGVDLISKLLAYDPDERISARQAVKHPYLRELHQRSDAVVQPNTKRTEVPQHQLPTAPGGGAPGEGGDAQLPTQPAKHRRSTKESRSAVAAPSERAPAAAVGRTDPALSASGGETSLPGIMRVAAAGGSTGCTGTGGRSEPGNASPRSSGLLSSSGIGSYGASSSCGVTGVYGAAGSCGGSGRTGADPCQSSSLPQASSSFDTSSLPSMRNTVAVEAAYEGGSNLPLIVSGAGGVTGRAGLKIDAKTLHGQGAGSQTGRASMKAGPYRRAGAGARKGASHRAAAGRLGHQEALELAVGDHSTTYPAPRAHHGLGGGAEGGLAPTPAPPVLVPVARAHGPLVGLDAVGIAKPISKPKYVSPYSQAAISQSRRTKNS